MFVLLYKFYKMAGEDIGLPIYRWLLKGTPLVVAAKFGLLIVAVAFLLIHPRG